MCNYLCRSWLLHSWLHLTLMLKSWLASTCDDRTVAICPLLAPWKVSSSQNCTSALSPLCLIKQSKHNCAGRSSHSICYSKSSGKNKKICKHTPLFPDKDWISWKGKGPTHTDSTQTSRRQRGRKVNKTISNTSEKRFLSQTSLPYTPEVAETHGSPDLIMTLQWTSVYLHNWYCLTKEKQSKNGQCPFLKIQPNTAGLSSFRDFARS